MQYFHLATVFDLTLILTFPLCKPYTSMLPFYPLRIVTFDKVGFTAFISPISIADKMKSDDFVVIANFYITIQFFKAHQENVDDEVFINHRPRYDPPHLQICFDTK